MYTVICGTLKHWLTNFGNCLVLLFISGIAAAQCVTVSPSSLGFGDQVVGRISQTKSVLVTNASTGSVTISQVSVSPSEFVLVSGGPTTLNPGASATYRLSFLPDSTKWFTGDLSLTVSCSTTPVQVRVSGTGVTASVSVSPTSLTFLNQPLGSTSPAQTITVTNTGQASFTVKAPYISPPFLLSGFTAPYTLAAGKSVAMNASFFGTFPGSYTGTLNIPFDVLPNAGVSLVANAVNAPSLAVNTLATLPAATQGAAYSATLFAAAGVLPYSWSLQSGSLPAGLTLSSNGMITGTVSSTAPLGNYTFSIQVQDSEDPPVTVSAQFSMPVDPATGANCNDISFDVAGTSTPLVPMTDLGTGTYLGFEGGLYPNGSNVRPAAQDAAGVALADAIQPLDANGNPDPNGAYAMISLGESDTQQEFIEFMTLANADPAKNPHLVLVNGAQPSGTAQNWVSTSSSFWTNLVSSILPGAGVTANQVVTAWVQTIDTQYKGTYPSDMTLLQSNLESIAQNLHTLFPNLTLAYYTGRIYGGYNLGITNYDPEPYAYESGWTVKAVIEDQLNGLPSLNFDPNQGPVMAPWLSWGPYYWANGMIPRSDGLVWTCQDFKVDGLHPANPAGREKVADALLNFFKTDDTTVPWFVAP